MADFSIAYAPLASFEGGWCNVQGDSGGETYAGIARRYWPDWPGWKLIDREKDHSSFASGASAFTRHLATVPGLSDLVSGWYRSEWWDRLGLTALPQDLANEIFEQSVNLGKGGSGKKVQLVCNAFNRAKAGNSLFADLAVDGVIGPRTLDALAALLARRTDEKALVHALNCMQGAHYIEVAARNPSQRKFVDGWMKRTHCPD